jgi:hypothetical protein
LWWLLACSSPPPPPEPPPVPQADLDARAQAKADAAVRILDEDLRRRVVELLADGGPAKAITPYADEAQAQLALAGGEAGAHVGRSSLRLRNPANAPPDWVEAWLTAQGERKAEGVTGFSRIYDTSDGRMARSLMPVAVEDTCIGCHGPKEGLDPKVVELLSTRYPGDAATGYQIGDLRGALWAEVPVR